MNGFHRTLFAILAALLLAGCAATLPPAPSPAPPPPVAAEPGTRAQPSVREGLPPSLPSPDLALFDEGAALLSDPQRPDMQKAREVFTLLLQNYPQSRWRTAVQICLRLIDETEALREASRREQSLAEKRLAERLRLLQENDQLKKTVREMKERLQTETAAVAQENETLRQDLQRLKRLEIELEKRERMLR